jgi:hypothetical protein
MNAIETMRLALAAVQTAYSMKPSGKSWLSDHIDEWEMWTGHHETRRQTERRLKREERFSKKYRKPTWEDRVTFDGDRRLYNETDFEQVRYDFFETLDTNSPSLEREIAGRLVEAVPHDVPEDVEFERKIDLRCQNQMDRMIIEDCTNSSSNRIEIPQLIYPGACNIPAHLRIEGISKFSRNINSMEDAKVMSRVLKALDIDFRTWTMKKIYRPEKLPNGSTRMVGLSMAKRLNNWATMNRDKPWMAPVGGQQLPLYELAEELLIMSQEEQETPEWANGMEQDDLAAFFPSDFKEPEKGLNLETENMVGEYTYHNVSRIPNGKEFKKAWSKFKPSEFKAAINAVDDMTNEEIAAFSKEVKKKGSFDQKDRWLAESRRVLNSRARESYDRPITMIPAVLEPTETEEEQQSLFERMDGWQFDEAGHRYEEFQEDPEEDILDDVDAA